MGKDLLKNKKSPRQRLKRADIDDVESSKWHVEWFTTKNIDQSKGTSQVTARQNHRRTTHVSVRDLCLTQGLLSPITRGSEVPSGTPASTGSKALLLNTSQRLTREISTIPTTVTARCHHKEPIQPHQADNRYNLSASKDTKSFFTRAYASNYHCKGIQIPLKWV
jgi:hypothetical protein